MYHGIPDMPDACFEAAFESLQMHTFLMCSGHILKELLPFRIQCAFRGNLRCYSDSMLGQ